MKRKIAMLLVVVLTMLTLTACGEFECDFCGEKKSGKSYKVELLGQEGTMCKDCKAGVDELKSLLD